MNGDYYGDVRPATLLDAQTLLRLFSVVFYPVGGDE